MSKHEAPDAKALELPTWLRLGTRARKLAVVLTGTVATAVTMGLVSDAAIEWVNLGLWVAAAYGVYQVPNTEEEESDE